MVEQSFVPVSTEAVTSQESVQPTQVNSIGSGYSNARPSFSYLNMGSMPSGNPPHPSSAPLDSTASLVTHRPVTSGLSMNHGPSFSYNVSHSTAGFPAAQMPSANTNVRAEGTQHMGAIGSAPAHTNSVPSANNFASNSYSNTNLWMHPAPTFQVPMGMPRTPTPGPPGIPPSVRSPSNMTIQHQTGTHFPSPSPQPAPGAWLQPQSVTGFARPPFSPYATTPPGLYPMPNRPSLSIPDTQPPGVSPVFSSGGQLSLSSGHRELPPGVDDVKKAEAKEETSRSEQLDAWTAHRTEVGAVYYYNALTGESTYQKPSGFEGESDKATVQPIPILWEKLAGTDWTLVTTNDGKKYYYNSTTQSSSWQIPSEVTELRKKQEANALKAQLASVTNTDSTTDKITAAPIISTPAANTGGRDSTALRPANASGPSALDLIKRKLQDSGLPASSVSPSGAVIELNGSKQNEVGPRSDTAKSKEGNGDDMSDSSSESEDESRGPSKDECISRFKEMLKERGVAPFSKWEKELPKLVFDPRFKAIPSHSARRALFEHYVRTRAEDERKEKRAAQKASLEAFKLLLDEAKEDIDHNMDYQAFKMKWGNDPRFQALDRKERESLLNERVLPLKRAARERAQAERAAAVSDFKSMLLDNGEITSTSRWSRVKDSLKTDPRYKSVKHEDREILFNEYIAELKAAGEEVEQKAKAKQEEEEKLKERERALRKRKEREEQEVERVKLKARRKEAVESYQALLVETIKDPQASWTESKPKLEKDPQGRAANPRLDKFDLEKLFREHVKYLQERCVLGFRSLLSEVITAEAAAQEKDGKTIINSWSTAKQILKNDPRYNKIPRKEREPLWRRHAEVIERKLKPTNDEEVEKYVESGKHVSSRRTHDRR